MFLPRLPKLEADHLDVMNFLNEIVFQYPSAISFAPGRPAEQFCDIEGTEAFLTRYIAHRADSLNLDAVSIRQQIGQYQKTNGMINEMICRFLAQDENIHVPPESVMVTNGAQEAMAILAAGLFNPMQEVLLVADPTYNGMIGVASILGIEMWPVPTSDEGLDLGDLQTAIQQVHEQRKKPKAFYLVPDFSNPLGTSMSYETRCHLLDIADEYSLLIFEDNPYGMLAYDAPPMPTLKSLDRRGVVIYLGTFSKVVFPGLRVGFLVADQRVADTGAGKEPYLAQELSKVKSLLSVNTSPLNQAIVGGMLLHHQYSLRNMVQNKIAFYRTNRDRMLESLEDSFGNDPFLRRRVTWSHPRGGLFLTVMLPFAFTAERLRLCAQEYEVICCPMSFFSLSSGREQQLRLSFSAVSQKEITQGVNRLWRFVHDCVRIAY